MRLASKGQVTIPQAEREKVRLHPHTEVEFEVQANGDVQIRRAAMAATPLRQAFERVRGSAVQHLLS